MNACRFGYGVSSGWCLTHGWHYPCPGTASKAEPIEPTSYTVELGGQTFTQAQWEAVQVYIAGTTAKVAPVGPGPRRPVQQCPRNGMVCYRPCDDPTPCCLPGTR